jgi:hypothetical protein
VEVLLEQWFEFKALLFLPGCDASLGIFLFLFSVLPEEIINATSKRLFGAKRSFVPLRRTQLN